MDLRRLRLFLAVVDHGGFTAAAAAIHVAATGAVAGVRELERELGATLLVRSRKGVVLDTGGRGARRAGSPGLARCRDRGGRGRGGDRRVRRAHRCRVAADARRGSTRRGRRTLPPGAPPRDGPHRRDRRPDRTRGRSPLGPQRARVSPNRARRTRASSSTRSPTKNSSPSVRAPATSTQRSSISRSLEGSPLVLTPRGTSMRNLVDVALLDAGYHAADRGRDRTTRRTRAACARGRRHCVRAAAPLPTSRRRKARWCAGRVPRCGARSWSCIARACCRRQARSSSLLASRSRRCSARRRPSRRPRHVLAHQQIPRRRQPSSRRCIPPHGAWFAEQMPARPGRDGGSPGAVRSAVS